MNRKELEAEEIVMAAEIGMFRGDRSELAMAVLILEARDAEIQLPEEGNKP